MGIERGYRPQGEMQPRDHLSKYLPQKQEELPARTMNDSFASALIPLSTDLDLQDKYVAFMGNVRLGRILEDMDLFAGWYLVLSKNLYFITFHVLVYVSHLHIFNPNVPQGEATPYTIVTVLVDKIDFTNFLPKVCQIKIQKMYIKRYSTFKNVVFL